MSVDELLPYLQENRNQLKEDILEGKYKPKPVRRVEIPKPDGGIRLLGIPTVIDRMIQQAIAQQPTPDSLPMWNYYLKEGKYEGYNLGFLPPS